MTARGSGRVLAESDLHHDTPVRAAHGAGKKWSADVTANSDALDLKPGVFTHDDPCAIAESIASPFRSAMSMLTLYVLARAKDDLRRLFGRSAKRE